MGFLKKITRPISKFLDKIVPNEIKPALPYLSAAAPFLIGPAGIGASGSFWNTMMGRALMAGGANLGSQLAQEGSEGEFDKMSLALASGIGALTAPGAASSIRGVDPNFVGPRVAPEGIMGTGKEWLAKGAEFLGPESGGASNILGRGGTKPGLNMATLKAASVPITQGTGDLARITAEQALRDFEDEAAETGMGVNDDGRRIAIRAAMEAAGHLEDDILDALGSLGLKQGGIVGLKHGGRIGAMGGGIMHAKRGLVNAPGGYAGEKEEVDFGGITEAVTAVEKKPKKFLVDRLEVTVMPGQSEMMAIINAMMNDIDGVMPDDRKQEFYNLYLPQLRDNGEISEKEYNFLMEELFNKANGGRINKAGGGISSVLPKGKEADYRGGGVIPVGSRERADDVPARLSKNEFVMTADAVRAAGGGSVNKGAKRMYNLMHNLEARV
jgi:hypothetical protein